MGKSKGKKGLTAQSSDVLQASEPPKIKSKRRKPHASAGVITLSSIATLVAAIGATYFLTSQAALPEQPVVAKQQREEIPLVQKTKQQPTGSAKKTKRERTVESQRASDDPSCAGWEEDGECESNPKLMRKLCPIACAGRLSDDDPALGEEKVKKMKGVAADTEENCAWWASAGECEKNPVFMLSSCATSCAHAASETGASRDTHQDCSAWVKDGECYRNPAFMLQQCKRPQEGKHTVPRVVPHPAHMWQPLRDGLLPESDALRGNSGQGGRLRGTRAPGRVLRAAGHDAARLPQVVFRDRPRRDDALSLAAQAHDTVSAHRPPRDAATRGCLLLNTAADAP